MKISNIFTISATIKMTVQKDAQFIAPALTTIRMFGRLTYRNKFLTKHSTN